MIYTFRYLNFKRMLGLEREPEDLRIKRLHSFFEFNSEQVYQLLLYINIWDNEDVEFNDIIDYITMHDTFHIFNSRDNIRKVCNTLSCVGLVRFDGAYSLTPLGTKYLNSCHW